MKPTELVNRIVNEYLNWEHWCEENGFDKGDDDLYKTWREGTTEEILGELESDLVDLCEDNEIMKAAIMEYFEDNK